MNNGRELPVLSAVAGFLRWCEELLIIVSGPLLTVGLGIALVDLLTGGAVLAAEPGLLYAWAISEAAGVDAQLVASAAKLAAAFHARGALVAVGEGVLIMPLAYVGFLVSNVFATQQSQGLTTAEALARLGMDGTSWIVQRSALAAAVVVLSGLSRYRPPAAEASAEDERAQLERELALEPLRAQLRARKALGWRDVGRGITRGASATAPVHAAPHAQEGASVPAKARKVEHPSDPVAGVQAPLQPQNQPATAPPQRPPTGPGSLASAALGRGANGRSTRADRSPVLRLEPVPEWRREGRREAAQGRANGRGVRTPSGAGGRRRQVATGTVEEQVRAAWQSGMSVTQLERAAGVSRNA